MAMGSSCAIFFFYKYIVAKHKRGKKKSHIFEETWSVLRGHKEAKMILLGCGGLAVPCQARAPDQELCRACLDSRGSWDVTPPVK